MSVSAPHGSEMQNDVRRLPMSHAALWLCLYVATAVLSGQFNVNTAGLAPYVWLPAGVGLAAMLPSRTPSDVALAIAIALVQSVLSHLGGRDIPSSLVLGTLAGVLPLIASAVIRWMKVPLEGLHLLPAVLIAAFLSSSACALRCRCLRCGRSVVPNGRRRAMDAVSLSVASRSMRWSR
jgi:hypothetical protein